MTRRPQDVLDLVAVRHCGEICLSDTVVIPRDARRIARAYLILCEMKRLGSSQSSCDICQAQCVSWAGVLAAVLAHHSVSGVEDCRWLLMVPTIDALLIWRVRKGLPESPRWLTRLQTRSAA